MVAQRFHLKKVVHYLETVSNKFKFQVNVSCAFPFVLEGNKYDSCTTDEDPDVKLWCSTKTDEENVHVPDGVIIVL